MDHTGSFLREGTALLGKQALIPPFVAWARGQGREQDGLLHHGGVQLPLRAKGASPLLLPSLTLALSPPPQWVCRTYQGLSYPLFCSLELLSAAGLL